MTAPTGSVATARFDPLGSPAPVSGAFVWHDLMSTDPARSVAFYTALFGWHATAHDIGAAGTYTHFHAGPHGEHAFGGVMPFDAGARCASHWISYVEVDDVDATCARAAAAGGRTCVAPTDIPRVGRFAIVADPSGAVLAPISLRSGRRPLPGGGPGTAWWHELASPVPEASSEFYRAVFGWRVETTPVPNGAHGACDGDAYWLLARGDDATAYAGGMYRLPRELPLPVRPHWMIYVAVDDADDAVARAVALGATPTFPCLDVPGTGRVGGFLDPTGAAIAVAQRAE